MLSFLKKNYRTLLESSLVLLSAFLIWSAEGIQEKVSPERFWQGKLNELEGVVYANKWRMQSLEIALEKEKLTQAIVQKKGYSESEKAEVSSKDKIVVLEKEIETIRQLLRQKEEKALFAKAKLETILQERK